MLDTTSYLAIAVLLVFAAVWLLRRGHRPAPAPVEDQDLAPTYAPPRAPITAHTPSPSAAVPVPLVPPAILAPAITAAAPPATSPSPAAKPISPAHLRQVISHLTDGGMTNIEVAQALAISRGEVTMALALRTDTSNASAEIVAH
jgi:hypothetical protein